MTIIAMLLRIFGIGLFVYEFGAKKGKSKNFINLLVGGLLLIGSMLIGIGGNPASDMPNGSKEMVIFGFALSIIGIIILSLKTNFKNKIYYMIPLSIIIVLVIICFLVIRNWNVHPTSSSSTGNGCYPNRPYYVCKDVKRRDGTTYQQCRCQAWRD